MKRTNYRRILSFIAKRVGYSGWKFRKYYFSYCLLVFTSDTGEYDNNEVNEMWNSESLHTLLFNLDCTPCKVLKSLLSHKDDIVIAEGHYKCKDQRLHLISPWVKLFNHDDTLESLAIEAELASIDRQSSRC